MFFTLLEDCSGEERLNCRLDIDGPDNGGLSISNSVNK